MTRPLEPPGGYLLENPSMDDLEEFWRFIARWDMEVAEVADFALDDLRQMAATPGFDAATDWWAVRNDGQIAALGIMWPRESGQIYSAFAIVDPSHRGKGLGSLLLALTERRAARLAAASLKGQVLIRTFTDERDPGGTELLRSHGWEFARSYYTMMGPLPTGRPVPDAPAGISIRTGTDDDLPLVHELIEETFAENYGFSPTPYDEWVVAAKARQDIDPSLWFFAEAGGEAAGIALAEMDADKGWIAILGVRKPNRGKGIAKALLRQAFATLEARGCTKVGLGVDASNESGAVALYEQVGLSKVRVNHEYTKTFGAPVS